MSITDFLINDEYPSISYRWVIEETGKNQFALKSCKSWVLKIWSQETDDEGEISDTDNDPLEFRMCKETRPTIKTFSIHIYNEIKFALDAVGLSGKWLNDYYQYFDRTDLEPEHIYKFMKFQNAECEKTEDFLLLYDHYQNWLYHNLKWFFKLSFGYGGYYCSDWDYPIGENLAAFLDLPIKYYTYDNND